ncbi:MAG: hypothetical protein C4522_09270 [Desulfobacteraceae bacterium]|nr:MAG: hypothetical protein C4522_09270 [Desulfobacteraceae bacterium]
MKKHYKVRLIHIVMIILVFGSVSCSQRQHFSFDVTSRLLGGGKVSMVVEVDFQDQAGVEELRNKLETIQYALYLVFSRKSAEELSSLGEHKTANSIYQILQKHLAQKAMAVRVQNFTIEPK